MVLVNLPVNFRHPLWKCRSSICEIFCLQFAPTSLAKMIPHACPEAVDLMTAMCAWDPNKRPTAVQCLQVWMRC